MPDYSKSKNVLVAGGAGYIGSHTAKALKKAGYTPVVLDNLTTGNAFAVRFGPFVEGSIDDQDLVSRVIRDYQVSGAILFAANAYVGESTQVPNKYYLNNVAGSLSFLEALVHNQVRALVFSSSCSIYGVQRTNNLITEDSPKGPLSPYAHTKLILEQTMPWYESAFGLRTACLRYFNAAGDDPDGEIGEHHVPETHLLPLTIYAAMGRDPLRVFGTDYPTPDGTAVRDYIHVVDLAKAHVRTLEYLFAGNPGVQVNLGTGQGHSVKEVIAAVEQVSKERVPVEYQPRRIGDAPVLVADPSYARRLLGWSPSFSSLDTLVQTAWQWHSQSEPRISVEAQFDAGQHSPGASPGQASLANPLVKVAAL
jgi:UDP-arabinose 4-epimerase